MIRRAPLPRRASPLKRSGKPSRYGVKRVEGSDGRSYASAWEREAMGELRLREKIGELRDLKFQVWFHLVVNGTRIESYIADATAVEKKSGKLLVFDAKRGLITSDYARKRKWMKAAHGIEIVELHAPRK